MRERSSANIHSFMYNLFIYIFLNLYSWLNFNPYTCLPLPEISHSGTFFYIFYTFLSSFPPDLPFFSSSTPVSFPHSLPTLVPYPCLPPAASAHGSPAVPRRDSLPRPASGAAPTVSKQDFMSTLRWDGSADQNKQVSWCFFKFCHVRLC